MKKILIILTIILLTGCGNKKEIATQTLDQIIESNNYQIVDVRTKEEYDEGHVKGAINIPYDEIDENTNLNKNKTIMVYCKSGKRSSIAYNTLKNLGYDVYDLGAYSSINLEKE